jgi:hypothetical protein
MGGFRSNLREKSLLVKEKWAFVLTRLAAVCYRQRSGAAVLCPPFWRSPGGAFRVGVVVVLGID